MDYSSANNARHTAEH